MIEEATLIEAVLSIRSQVDFLWQFFIAAHIAIFALPFIYDEAVESLNVIARAAGRDPRPVPRPLWGGIALPAGLLPALRRPELRRPSGQGAGDPQPRVHRRSAGAAVAGIHPVAANPEPGNDGLKAMPERRRAP